MSSAFAQQDKKLAEKASPEKPPLPEVKVAAKVNGDSIFVAEVEREVRRVIRDQSAHPDTMKLLQAQALQQLVDRSVILAYLERNKQAASSQDIELEVQRLTKQLKQVNKTLAEHTRALGLDDAGLRRQFAWHIGWSRYLERHMTDDNLAKYFEKHRRDYDGTQLRVAHILFKIATENDPAATAAAVERAAQARQEIAANKITFEQAAAKYSEAPTKTSGGDIGLIGRHDPMPESFSRVAYSLEKGQISEPVVSPYGVHLILCREIVPGKKTWQDVRADLEPGVSQFLYSWIADRERATAKIEFTDATPHLKPGTQEIVP